LRGWRLDAIDVGVVVIALAMLVSLWASPDRTSSVTWVVAMAPWLAAYAAVSRAARTREWQVRVASGGCTLAGALALAVIGGAGQLGWPEKMPLVHGAGRALDWLLPGPFGLRPMPNSAATAVVVLVPLAWWLAGGAGGRAARWAGAGSAIALSGLLVLTTSRGAWVGLAAGLVAAVVSSRHGPRRRGWTALGCAVAGAVVAALPVLFDTSIGRALARTVGRPDRWDVYVPAASLVHDFAFSGFGPGSPFATALARDALLIEVPFVTYAHHLPMDLWLALGPLGVVAWLLLVCGSVAAVGDRGYTVDRFDLALLTGVLASAAHGFFDARPIVDPWTWGPFFVVLGLVRARRVPDRRRPACIAPLLAVGGFLAVWWLAAPPAAAQWSANLGALDELRAWYEPARASELRASAAKRFEDTLAADATNRTALWRVGRRATDEGRFDAAVCSLSAAHLAAPANATIRKALGLALMWDGRPDDAADFLRGLPGIAGELNTWGAWRESRAEFALAAAAFRASLAVDAQQLPVRERLRQLEVQLKVD
jgi:hypothetical protein